MMQKWVLHATINVHCIQRIAIQWLKGEKSENSNTHPFIHILPLHTHTENTKSKHSNKQKRIFITYNGFKKTIHVPFSHTHTHMCISLSLADSRPHFLHHHSNWFVILAAFGILLFFKLYTTHNLILFNHFSVPFTFSSFLSFPQFGSRWSCFVVTFRTFKTLLAIFLVLVAISFSFVLSLCCCVCVCVRFRYTVGGRVFILVIFTMIKLLTCSCLPLFGYLQSHWKMILLSTFSMCFFSLLHPIQSKPRMVCYPWVNKIPAQKLSFLIHK